jgi:hypothetical protein
MSPGAPALRPLGSLVPCSRVDTSSVKIYILPESFSVAVLRIEKLGTNNNIEENCSFKF